MITLLIRVVPYQVDMLYGHDKINVKLNGHTTPEGHERV